MTLNSLLAIGFALASALSIAWGTVIRHRIAEEAPSDGTLAGSPFLVVIRRPAWWGGMVLAFSGYGLQIVALAFGSLLLVQPILVLSLMFTLPLAAVYAGRRISFSETAWSLALSLAVAVLVILGRPLPGDAFPALAPWLIALTIGVVTLGAMTSYSRRLIRGDRALLLGIVTGATFGYVAVLSKAAVDRFTAGGPVELITTWELYGLIIGATLGTIVQQYSFNAGSLRESLPAMTVAEPLVAFSLGYAVLGERFQATDLQWIWMALAVVVMVLSTVILARKSID